MKSYRLLPWVIQYENDLISHRIFWFVPWAFIIEPGPYIGITSGKEKSRFLVHLNHGSSFYFILCIARWKSRAARKTPSSFQRCEHSPFHIASSSPAGIIYMYITGIAFAQQLRKTDRHRRDRSYPSNQKMGQKQQRTSSPMFGEWISPENIKDVPVVITTPCPGRQRNF